jgi:hypothetical protein
LSMVCAGGLDEELARWFYIKFRGWHIIWLACHETRMGWVFYKKFDKIYFVLRNVRFYFKSRTNVTQFHGQTESMNFVLLSRTTQGSSCVQSTLFIRTYIFRVDGMWGSKGISNHCTQIRTIFDLFSWWRLKWIKKDRRAIKLFHL